jgi:hypothetical protein
MSPTQPHRCFVRLQGDGRPFLAFEPSSGRVSSYSSSLFTLDLKPNVTVAEAEALAAQINGALHGVSTTVF